MPPSHPSRFILTLSLSLTALSTFKIFPVVTLPPPLSCSSLVTLPLRVQTANLFFLRDSVEKSSCHPFLSRLPVAYRTHLPIHIHTHIHIFQYVADICPLSRALPLCLPLSHSLTLSVCLPLVRGVLVHGISSTLFLHP